MPLLKYEAKPSIKLSFHLFVLNDCVWSSSFGNMWFLIHSPVDASSEAFRGITLEFRSPRKQGKAMPFQIAMTFVVLFQTMIFLPSLFYNCLLLILHKTTKVITMQECEFVI